MSSLPFLDPVIPPHVFCLSGEGLSCVQFRREPKPAVALLRRYPYLAGAVTDALHGAPVFSPSAFTSALADLRRVSGANIPRASAVFPDAWSRVVTLDFEALPDDEPERREILGWRLKKLLSVRVEDLEIAFREIPPADGGRRLLVASVSRGTIRSLEEAFSAAGVRLGWIAPESLTLFDGLDGTLTAAAGGDYLFVHRSRQSFALFIARRGLPLLWRQKTAVPDDETVGQEIRLSLSYYAETYPGSSLAKIFCFDTVGEGRFLAELEPGIVAELISARLLSADSSVDEYGESLPALAAVLRSE